MPKLVELQDKLEIEKQKLHALLEITNSINQNYKVKELLELFKNVLVSHIGVSKIILINNRNNWESILEFGLNQNYDNFDIEEFLTQKKTLILKESSLKKYTEFDLLLPVFHKQKPLSFLLIGIEESSLSCFIESHVGFVQTLANIVSVSIETKMLANEVVNKKIQEKDMEMAAEMQKLLFPRDLPSNHKVDVAATYIPKQMVSGDYYDFIRFSEDEYVFCIADVSGKGMSAAMLMSNFQANVRANTKFNNKNLTLKKLIEVLNTGVIDSAKGEKFITFFIGYYNEQSRILKYINAGHNYPLLITKNKIKELKKGSTALGIFEELPSIETEEVEIEPNTVIVCYTDGIVEVENEKGVQFETDRLSNVLLENSFLNMEEMNKSVFGAIDKFKGENELPDDTALLSIRII